MPARLREAATFAAVTITAAGREAPVASAAGADMASACFTMALCAW